MKNIALLFDGTWNKPAEASRDPESACDTNVRRFYKSIETFAEDGSDQVAWYDTGVGTEWFNKVRGGAFGRGLDKNITDGYSHLCKNYKPGDRVYLLGFSRGAYTARSLVGLIRNSGVLRDPTDDLVMQAYELYRTRDESADSEAATTFRDNHSREIEIDFIGVWDTVGSLGLPVKSFAEFNAAQYGFHDTQLSRIVKNAFHALALDEHRAPYAATLWGAPGADEAGGQRLEQVWFAGAHADVGGGYLKQPLSNPPLRWMQERAKECGLNVSVLPEAKNEADRLAEYHADATDSFREFLGGAYAMISERFLRPVQQAGDGPQQVHWTLARRLQECERYHPRNPGLSMCLARSTTT